MISWCCLSTFINWFWKGQKIKEWWKTNKEIKNKGETGSKGKNWLNKKEKEGVDDKSKDGENDEDDPYFGGDKSMEQEEVWGNL